MGHVISCEGVDTDSSKVSAIVEWPSPTNITELRSFLGLASYYRRFIRHFAEIAAPLHRLQERGVTFNWTARCEDAFKALKLKLSTAPVLAFPSTVDTFVLDTDASELGIGAVLSQVQEGVERVVAYGSRTLTKSEKNYSTTRKELLALVYFLKHFRCYLLGKLFLVRTDHASLKWLQQFKEPEGQLARWLEQLQEFNFQLEHQSGKLHNNADALSRVTLPPADVVGTNTPVSVIQWDPLWTTAELKRKQRADPVLNTVLTWMELTGNRPPSASVAGCSPAVRSLWSQWNRLVIMDGVLHRWWEDSVTDTRIKQLIVPKSLVPLVLKHLHDGAGGGHLGVHKTLNKVRKRFYWPGLNTDVEDWCRQCRTCAESKSPSQKARGHLHPSRVGQPMERIALDLFGPLPSTKRGNKYILIVSDYFTRWIEAYALPNMEALTVAKTLVTEWICKYGVPHTVHSDQGKNFELSLFLELCRLLGMEKTRTTPYHPQSDGLVERFNRTLRMLLTVRMNEVSQDTWDDELPC